MKKFLKILAFITLVVLIIGASFIVCLSASVKNYNLDESKLINKSINVEYYDKDGNLFYTDCFNNQGEYISIDKLSKNTINAFISIEDKRFFKHNGVDYVRVLGATVSNIKSMSFKEGGSTISQQLIKNTHLSSEKTLKRKFAEIKITKQLEKRYSKSEILEKYLNTIYFGNGAYGINSASRRYFNKTADKLTLNESCLLAGIIKSPSKYSPIQNYEKSIERKNLVLKTMVENGFISNEVYKNNLSKTVNIARFCDSDLFYPYILGAKSELESILKSNPYVFNKNIKIYTYLDANLQKEVMDIEVSSLPKTDKLQIIINTKNNGIIAFYTTNSIYKRSPASCVKPWLVYAPMINDKIITESTVVFDNKIDFNGYSPKNYGGKYYGNVTVKNALSKSLNVPSVKLLNGYTLEKANNYTKKLGVDISNGNLSYALGNIDGGMTLKELCDCYSTFSDCGNFTSSAYIDKIYIDNKPFYRRKINKTNVFSGETAYIINDILKESVKSGTSKNLNVFDFDLCAKTGTNGNSSGNIDAYSISYTTNHIIGVWLGNSDGSIMPNSISGGTYPTIYNREMIKLLYKNYKPNSFSKPQGIIESNIDEETLLKEQKTYLTNNNGATYFYISGTQPKEYLTNNLPENLQNNENKISLNNGIVEILLQDNNYKNLKIIRRYKKQNKTIYNDKFVSKINDKIVDFGEYEYTIYITDSQGKTIVFTLSKINFTKDSLNILDNDWWDD